MFKGTRVMYKVGIIGGIGSGKSTVAEYFTKLGIKVVDADIIVRELTTRSSILNKIKKCFGKPALKNDGNLDRNYLRKIIFKNYIKKKWLENLLHPLVYQELERQANQAKSPYCILVIPLLIESPPSHKLLDRILLIDSSKKLQLERSIKRDKTNSSMIKAIINSQATNQKRLQIADDVIKNTNTLKDLKEQVDVLHKKYLALSAALLNK